MYVQSLSFIWYFAPWWGFLTPFDEHMLPWEVDQNFCSLVKSPTLVHIPPPPTGITLIGTLVALHSILVFVRTELLKAWLLC